MSDGHNMFRFHILPIIKGFVVLGAAVALWAGARELGKAVERAHRREFLNAFGIAPTDDVISSDSAVGSEVRRTVLRRVPLGSDTLAIKAFVQGFDFDPFVGKRRLQWGDSLWVSSWPVGFPERTRWYEITICAWDREVEFVLDVKSMVQAILVRRIGACL
jgi:hypothetical protein